MKVSQAHPTAKRYVELEVSNRPTYCNHSHGVREVCISLTDELNKNRG